MIIMAPPYGMGALIRLTCVGIWLARCLDKIPVIWWGTSCLYSRDQRINYYEIFFKAPAGATGEPYNVPLAAGAGSVYPDYWQAITPLSLQAIDEHVPPNDHYPHLEWKNSDSARIRNAEVCVLHSHLGFREAWALAGRNMTEFDAATFDDLLGPIFREFFAPGDAVLAAAKVSLADLLAASNYKIGLHYRSSDKVAESTVPSVKRHALTALKLGKDRPLLDFFVATDSAPGLAELRRRLGPHGRVMVQAIDRTSSLTPLHYLKASAFQNAIDMGVDVELLAQCAAFCGNSESGVFWWVKHRRQALGVDGPLVHIEPGFEDVLTSVVKFGKIFGARRAVGIAPYRIREWAVGRLKQSGLLQRNSRRALHR